MFETIFTITTQYGYLGLVGILIYSIYKRHKDNKRKKGGTFWKTLPYALGISAITGAFGAGKTSQMVIDIFNVFRRPKTYIFTNIKLKGKLDLLEKQDNIFYMETGDLIKVKKTIFKIITDLEEKYGYNFKNEILRDTNFYIFFDEGADEFNSRLYSKFAKEYEELFAYLYQQRKIRIHLIIGVQFFTDLMAAFRTITGYVYYYRPFLDIAIFKNFFGSLRVKVPDPEDPEMPRKIPYTSFKGELKYKILDKRVKWIWKKSWIYKYYDDMYINLKNFTNVEVPVEYKHAYTYITKDLSISGDKYIDKN